MSASEKDADRRLNEIYTTLRKSLGEAGKQALKLEQVVWLKERDAIGDSKTRLEFVQQRIAELSKRIANARTQLDEQTPPTPASADDFSASEKDADRRLNETYTTLRKLLGAGREYTLLLDQTDWLK